MARSIPDDVIRQIKNTANIVDVIADSVVLKQAGRNYLGLCPFHAEKTPSFTVSPDKQIFYCFGCHTGGNVFSFLMQREGCSFPEAVRNLAGRHGIAVPEPEMTPAQKEQFSEKDRLYRINEEAVAYFRQTLRDPQTGQRAMSYLVGRGMTLKIMDGYQLGYAAERWDGLLRHFQQKKIPPGLVAKAGLIIPRKDGSGYYDRFRERVMLPIYNASQQVIGFGGRVLGEELPKYLNSPETSVFTKRRSLYGIHKAKTAARTSGRVYLVEGYFDVLALHLYGIENAVATLGTALTPEHVQMLRGMIGPAGQVVLVYDSDQAGIKAAQRSVAIFEAGFMDARVLVLPQGYDPDLYLREFGPQDFLKAAENALGMISFLIESAIQAHGLALEGKIKVMAALQQPLAAVHDAVARALYVKQLAERLSIEESAIMEKVNQAATLHVASGKAAHTDPIERRLSDSQRLEQQVVAMLFRSSTLAQAVVEHNLLDYFEDAKLKAIAQLILAQSEPRQEHVADVVSMIDEPEYRSLMVRLALSETHWDREGCERLLGQLAARGQRRFTQELQRQIEMAEKSNDIDLLCKLLRQKQDHAAKARTL